MTDRIAAFAGSIRRKSYNRVLVEAARVLAPPGMSIEPVEIAGLPFYNDDIEAEGDPDSVAAFKSALHRADGVLIATPEYNDGIPGVLGNALDWASRLPGRAPLVGKPVALMGASPSQIGTARAQLHLRQILGHVHARVLPAPEMLVAQAHLRFDPGCDSPTRARDASWRCCWSDSVAGLRGSVQPSKRNGSTQCTAPPEVTGAD